jgi:hypothetical protein
MFNHLSKAMKLTMLSVIQLQMEIQQQQTVVSEINC